MNSQPASERKFSAPIILTMISALTLALIPVWPYRFYIVLRTLMLILSVALIYFAQHEHDKEWRPILVVACLVYNPFFPLHLNRLIWTLVNVVTIFVLGLGLVSTQQENLKREKKKEAIFSKNHIWSALFMTGCWLSGLGLSAWLVNWSLKDFAQDQEYQERLKSDLENPVTLTGSFQSIRTDSDDDDKDIAIATVRVDQEDHEIVMPADSEFTFKSGEPVSFFYLRSSKKNKLKPLSSFAYRKERILYWFGLLFGLLVVAMFAGMGLYLLVSGPLEAARTIRAMAREAIRGERYWFGESENWLKTVRSAAIRKPSSSIPDLPEFVIEREFELPWRLGARTSAAISACAKKFKADTEIWYGGNPANATNIMEMLMLGPMSQLGKAKTKEEKERIAKVLAQPGETSDLNIKAGARVKVVVSGSDARLAIEALSRVFNDGSLGPR